MNQSSIEDLKGRLEKWIAQLCSKTEVFHLIDLYKSPCYKDDRFNYVKNHEIQSCVLKKNKNKSAPELKRCCCFKSYLKLDERCIKAEAVIFKFMRKLEKLWATYVNSEKVQPFLKQFSKHI